MPRVGDAPPRADHELAPAWRQSVGDYVTAATFTPDGSLCLVGAGNGDAIGLDGETGVERLRVRAHADGLLGVAIAPDGARFATCGHAPSARLWSTAGAPLAELPGGGAAWVEHVAWAPVGGLLATGAGRRVRVWTAEGTLRFESEPLASSVTGLAWRSDGSGVLASCYGGVTLFPMVAGARERTFAWKGSLISLALSPDDKVVACASQDCAVHFWRLSTGKDSQMSGYAFKPRALAWDDEARLLATSGDADVTLWDFRGKGPEGTRPIQLEGHKALCTRLAFAPRSGMLASGAQDTSVLLWEPRRGRRPVRYAFLDDEITALGWHPRQRAVFAGDAAGNVALWKAP